MKKNNKKELVSKRAKASMNEALVEGAASMSGQSAKQIAKGLVGGAIGEATAQKRKIRNKAQRRQFINSLRKTKKPGVTINFDEMETEFLQDKPSGFKMKRTVKTFDFGSTKAKNKRDYTAKEEMDFSPHNISARRTEGTIKQQAKLRAARGKK